MAVQYGPGPAYTDTGFKLTPEPAEGARKYFKDWNRAKMLLSERGIGPDTPCFVAEREQDDEDLIGSSSGPRKPAVVAEVRGDKAAQLMADRGFRMARPEEIIDWRNEQKRREEECDRIEANSPENRKYRSREVTRETIVMSHDEAERRGLLAQSHPQPTPPESPVPPPGKTQPNRTGKET